MSSDFHNRFKGKTEIMNKQGINGIVQNSATPIDKSEGLKTLNVNQYQPYRNNFCSYFLKKKKKLMFRKMAIV